jgi:hypothetical protein
MKKLFGRAAPAASATAQPTPTQTPRPVMIVSGLPRSGTSMMMKMLAAGGVSPLTDELRAADKDNPKGYYEYERVKQLDKGDAGWLYLAQGKVVKVISLLLHHLPRDYAYQVIFLRRNIDEILASQRKMLVHRGEDANAVDDAQMAALLQKHLQHVEQWMARQPNVEVLYVHYGDMMADPLPQIGRITRFLGRDLDEAAMAQVVDPNLYRNRQPVGSG